MSDNKPEEAIDGIKLLGVKKTGDNHLKIELSDADAAKIHAMFPTGTLEEAVNHYVNLALSHYLKDEASVHVEAKLPAPDELKTFTKSGD
jgi:hypothetical protein